MKFSDWTVMADSKNQHTYFYGPLEDFDVADFDGLTIIPMTEWNAEDYSEIIGNITEDNNSHRFCRPFSMILNALQKNYVPEATQANIMREIVLRVNSEIYGETG